MIHKSCVSPPPSNMRLRRYLTCALLSVFLGCSPTLHEAAVSGDIKQLRAVLARSPNLDEQDEVGGATAVFCAVDRGQVEALRILLEAGANPNIPDSRSNSPVHLVLYRTDIPDTNRIQILQLLLEHGANPNVINENGVTPLGLAVLPHWTSEKFSVAAVRLLLDHRADPNMATDKVHGFTALHITVGPGFDEIVETLLAHGGDPNRSDKHGRTSLHYAVAVHADTVIRLLLAHGADPNARDSMRRTPLHYASATKPPPDVASLFAEKSWISCIPCVAELIKAGADPGARDSTGRTPLYYASCPGTASAAPEFAITKIVGLLLDNEAVINATDDSETTPLHCAAQAGSVTLITLLVRKGARPSARDIDGNTPLHIAAANLADAAVQALLTDSGRSEANTTNKRSQTPLSLACGAATTRNKGGGSLITLREVPRKPLDEIVGILDQGNVEREMEIQEVRPIAPSLVVDETRRSRQVKVVKLLLDAGALLSTKDVSGKTPLDVAVETMAAPEAIRMLKESRGM